MSELIIFHNTRCSKSRQTLQLIQDRGLEPNIIDYLNTPPTESELHKIIQQLGFSSARQLLRHSEAEYKTLNLDDTTLTETALIQAMVSHPKLIERPIVIVNGKAALGRPPEQVLSLL